MSDAARDFPAPAFPTSAGNGGAASNGAAANGTGPAGAGGAAPLSRRAADGAHHHDSERADQTLYLLLRAAERGRRVGLTVMVEGTVVSGTLVGTVEYCRALADQFAAAEGGTEMDEEFADAFHELVDNAQGVAHGDRRYPADAASFERATRFLHLAEARYVSGPAFLPPGRHGVLWRCRVEDVRAWSLGDLTSG